MQKISVGRCIARAYGFLLGRFFPIIGLAWLPALIYAGLQFHVLQTLVTMFPGGKPEPSELPHVAAFFLGVAVMGALLRASIAISLTQDALGARKDLTLAHLVVGPRELRLFLAAVRLVVVFAAGYIAWAVATVIGMTQATHLAAAGGPAALIVNGHPLLPFVVGIVAFALLITLLLAILRLGFLIVPIAAVEHNASLTRSWALTKSSAWRIVVILLATIFPVAFAAGCAVWYATGNALSNAVHHMTSMHPADPTYLFQYYADHALLLASVSALSLIVTAALGAGAMSAAYKTVTGHDEEEHDDDEAIVAPLMAPVDTHHEDAHGGHEDHGHHGHDDHGHGGDEDHANGAHEDQEHHGHDDHAHGGHEDQGNGREHEHHGQNGHENHEQGDHESHDHGAQHDDAHGGHGDDEHGHSGDHDDHGHGGHEEHGQSGHDGHGDSHHSVPSSGALDPVAIGSEEREAA